MSAGDGVGAHWHLHPRCQRFLEHWIVGRHGLFHEREAFLRVVPDAEELRLVLDVVLEHEADVRIEVDAMIGHVRERLFVDIGAVLDLGAPGSCGRQDRIGRVGVDEGTEPDGLRFAARGAELHIGHRFPAAVANALGGEDLDQIGPGLFRLSHVRANFLGTAGALVHGSERGEDAWAWQNAASDRVAQLFVGRRPDALDRREAVDERHPGILGAKKRRLAGRLVSRVGTAVLEMTTDVDMHVDEAGQERAIAQVVRHRARALIDLGDLRTLHFDGGVLQNLALAVDHARGADCDRLVLRRGIGCRQHGRARGGERDKKNDAHQVVHEQPLALKIITDRISYAP